MVPRTPQVSVIMSACDAGRCVRRAVESLQNQTMRDFELLVVDDGSTDRTGDIVDKIAERDIRITVFHEERGGEAQAYNRALDRARGTYVHFMGASDWVEPRMLESMVDLAERSSLELVVTGYCVDTHYGEHGEHVTETKSRPDAIYPTQQEFRAAAWQLFDQDLIRLPWNKLYVRQRIEDLGLRFHPTARGNTSFVLDYVRDVERVGVLEQTSYHAVRTRDELRARGWQPDLYESCEEEHDWMLDLYRHWELDGDSASMEMIQRRYIECLVGCIEHVCSPSCPLPRRDRLDQIETMICSDRTQLAAASARPRSNVAKTLLVPVKAKNAHIAYQEGKLISFVRRHNAKGFDSLRAC